MIGDDVLERALGAAAADYEVPAGAIDRLRDQLSTPPADTRAHRLRSRRPTRKQWLAGGAAASVVVIAAAFALGGSGSGGGGTSAGSAGGREALRPGTGHQGTRPVPAPMAGAAAGVAGATTGGGPAKPPAAAQAPHVTPFSGDSARVVKTGELDLQVKKSQVGPTLSRLTALAAQEHGYVADSQTTEGGGAPGGRVTMRVPVAGFEDTVAKARGYGKVMSLQTSGKDVTGEYTDIQARIKALKATRETFLTLLSRASTIGETLAVQQHITDVQTQIDQLEGRRKLLANQSDLATLTVSVNQAVAPVPAPKPHHQSGLAKAVDTSVGRFVRGVEVIIGLVGPIVLVLLVLAVGWLGSRFGYRMLRRRLV